MHNIRYTRDVFLLCMSAIYLIAFSSLYVQIPVRCRSSGLYGDNGILPAKLVIGKDSDSWEELLEGQPTLLKLTPKLGLDVQTGMDLLCLVGMVMSFMCVIFKSARDTVSFILLWMLYLSLYQVGQTFLWFQWDILLLEIGFLTILVAPFNLQIPWKKYRPLFYHHHDSITMWLVRWLLFRLMFASGVVKLTSRCPTWWGLTALNWHFESQCIPTPLAWYWHHFPVWFLKLGVVATYLIQIPTPFLFFSPVRSMRVVAFWLQCIPTPLAWYWHHLPEWFLKLSVVATYVIEIPAPFLFFAPVRSMRIVAFWSQVLLQVLIILTGNYNFFNLLTIVLCLSLLDDEFFGYKKKKPASRNYTNLVASVVVYGYILYQTVKLFNLTLTPDFTVESNIGFTETDFNRWLEMVVPWTIWFGVVSLAFEVVVALVRCFTEEKGWFWKNWAAVQCLVFATIAAGMFSISLVPHSVIERKAERRVPQEIRKWHDKVEPFQLVNSYGLFRSMTGVGGRPEVIVEGSNSRDEGWKAYEFLYKPGHLKRRPPIVAPHQPRLDWQMWFAALGTYQHNPWFLNLAYRLLNNQPEVLDLIAYNPFPDKPPKYLCAKLYKYHYTSGDKPTTSWWSREETGEYLPVISKDEPNLVGYLKHAGVIEKSQSKKKKSKATYLSIFVHWVRDIIGQPEGFVFVMTLLISALSSQFIVGIVMS